MDLLIPDFLCALCGLCGEFGGLVAALLRCVSVVEVLTLILPFSVSPRLRGARWVSLVAACRAVFQKFRLGSFAFIRADSRLKVFPLFLSDLGIQLFQDSHIYVPLAPGGLASYSSP